MCNACSSRRRFTYAASPKKRSFVISGPSDFQHVSHFSVNELAEQVLVCHFRTYVLMAFHRLSPRSPRAGVSVLSPLRPSQSLQRYFFGLVNGHAAAEGSLLSNAFSHIV